MFRMNEDFPKERKRYELQMEELQLQYGEYIYYIPVIYIFLIPSLLH